MDLPDVVDIPVYDPMDKGGKCFEVKARQSETHRETLVKVVMVIKLESKQIKARWFNKQ